MNLIKFLFFFFTLFIHSNLNSKEIYKIKIMGIFEGETLILPNQGKFNMFTANAAFSDSNGNYGDAIGRGVRETDKNNKITNLYAVLILDSPDGSKMMVRPVRTESDIKAGTGSFKITYAKGLFEKYLGYNCKYGISTTKNGSFIQEVICK